MKEITLLKKRFKKIYQDEFDDPNESFMNYLLDLISKEQLEKAIKRGSKHYSSLFYRYK